MSNISMVQILYLFFVFFHDKSDLRHHSSLIWKGRGKERYRTCNTPPREERRESLISFFQPANLGGRACV